MFCLSFYFVFYLLYLTAAYKIDSDTHVLEEVQILETMFKGKIKFHKALYSPFLYTVIAILLNIQWLSSL